MKHFLLVKQPGHTRAGKQVTARIAAEAILNAGFWPLWRNSLNRRAIQSGDQIAVYLAGVSEVVARARIADVEPWTGHHETTYPLLFEGMPFGVLTLREVCFLSAPVQVKHIRDSLSFIKPGSKSWGTAFRGGSRQISDLDFRVLTGLDHQVQP